MSELPFPILYEDNHLIAVLKPAGLLTQPTDEQTNSLETIVKQWIKETYHKPGNVFLGVVHRLDKPVSGIVLFAKTSKALSRLNESMRSKEMKKTYLALVEGKLETSSGKLEHYLKHDDYVSTAVSSKDPQGKRAILHYQVIHEKNGCSEVRIILETGRYHQIRSQFAAAGHPILGDAKYGSKKPFKGNEIALCHETLEFIHPVTLSPIAITLPHQDWEY